MPFRPGDNWAVCDITGKKVLMSETRKTWDGLRVWKNVWYPKHPQLAVRGIRERINVRDARPRPADEVLWPDYGTWEIFLQSSGGLLFKLVIDDTGTVGASPISYMPEPPEVNINGYALSVDDAGTISLTSSATTGPAIWLMASPNGIVWTVTVTAGAFVTAES